MTLARPWIDKVRMSLASGATTHPFQEADLEELRAILGPRHLHERCPGQPFLLDLVSHLASLSGDPDWEFPLTLKEGVPLGVSDPTLTSPGVWPTKEELKGEAWLGEDPPPPVAHLFGEEIESTFYEERALDMVDGPFTRSEAAERCRCKPDELCPGPLAGIDESDKIRTIYDGSKGGANAHIQAHTAEKTTAPMVGDCLHAIHWLRTAADHPHLLWATLPNTEERLRDVHQPVQGQSPGAEGPERDPRSTSHFRAEGPDRGRGIMDTPGGMDISLGSTPSGKGPLPGAEGPDRRPPFPPPPPGMECPGESGGEPLSWQPPTRGETFIILKADVTKAHRRIKVLPKDWKYQVACIQNRWWVNRVGTYGMASAQLYWGRKASLVLRLLYYIFPQVDWHLVFVDDYCWVLRCSRADWDATAILATLLALGVPLSWKKTALSPINTWLGFVVDPITPCVLLAPVKHVIILATLKRLAQKDIFTSKEVEQALGRIQWATSACPLTKPFLQPFWSWKKACTTSGRPPKLVRALAILLGRLFNQRFPLASPFAPTLPWTGASDAGAGRQADHAWVGGWCSDVPNPEKSRVKWFQHRITPEGEPWAFATGDPQRAIAALELFGLLLLVRAVLLCAAGSASHTRILVASDNQGNVFSLLNDSTRRMPNAAILMEIVLTLHDQQVMLGPSHVKRDFNTWADELTHPDPQFPTENRVFPSVESELITLIFATFLPHS